VPERKVYKALYYSELDFIYQGEDLQKPVIFPLPFFRYISIIHCIIMN
jgi:hypothetical protein